MVNFKICVRKINSNGFYPVYIRFTHRRAVGYIRTDWTVDRSGLRRGEVKDAFVIENCSRTIGDYIRKLNGVDTSGWDMKTLRAFLCGSDAKTSFSDFARRYVKMLEAEGGINNSRLYLSALASFEGYMGSKSVAFEEIVRERIEGWLESLSNTRRARTLYARCMRKVFEQAMLRSGEPDSDISEIRYNPWGRIRIPSSRHADKRAISVEDCRRFFGYREVEGLSGRERLGLDVALLSFCLAGINTVDLYNLNRSAMRNGVIGYNRSKTCSRRSDGAYFEIAVNEMASGLLSRYAAADDSKALLCFREQYNSARSFNAVVNCGIRLLCERMELPNDEHYSFYTFRHTWATIARNTCGASLSEVGFAMNHIQGDAVTRGYIKPDFSPAWKLNASVQAAVFEGKADAETQEKPDDTLGLSPKMMVYARAYFRGEVLVEVSDIGFGTVDAVIARLAECLPDTIPVGCAVQFRIKNVDTDREAVYERTKDKGF